MFRTIIVTLIFASFFLPEIVFAGPQEGISAEFRAVEESIRRLKSDPKELQKTLEANLVRAMRGTIRRRFYEDQKTYLQGLTAESLAYERNFSDNVYVVKYKDFIVRFDFARDPRIFVQSPKYEKFLLLDSFKNGDTHTTDGQPSN